MNTGAEDDSLSTPTLAFALWQCPSDVASNVTAIANRLANASRAKFGAITFPPSSQPHRNFLILSDKGALLFQLRLQPVNGDLARNRITGQRQRRGGAGGLPHGKARARHPRSRLAVMGHRGAAPGDQQV